MQIAFTATLNLERQRLHQSLINRVKEERAFHEGRTRAYVLPAALILAGLEPWQWCQNWSNKDSRPSKLATANWLPHGITKCIAS